MPAPPEDVGGIGGYAEFLKAVANPNHAEHIQYLEWVGGHFDPAHFDLNSVNKRLRQNESGQIFDSEIITNPNAEAQLAQKIQVWAKKLTESQFASFDLLPLRSDMLTFLNYLQTNRVVGTSSTGNLPLKGVREISEKFVSPPELDTSIGKYVHKLSSETEVWPLYFIHIIAFFGGLIEGAPARVWRVTPSGKSFLALPAPNQVGFLLANWWYRVDWREAYDFESFSRDIPSVFYYTLLNCLRELVTGEQHSFETFVDHLIAKSGLVWPIEDQKRARDTWHWTIQQMVIEPLTSFGILDCQNKVKIVYGFEFTDLDTICLTSLGQALLQIL